MRFSALLGKELRECLPWILLAAILLFAMGGFMLRGQAHYGMDVGYWGYGPFSPGTAVSPYQFTHYSQIQGPGALLFCVSIWLGLALGVRQFWVAHFTRTWPFLLHRSVSRTSILGAKLAAAVIGFIVSLGVVWLLLYWYACRPGLFKLPAPISHFVGGWLFMVLGLVVYLGTALCGLSRAKWYTTKIFGLVFATVIIVTTLSQWTLAGIFAVIAVSIVILLSQVVYTFLNREF